MRAPLALAALLLLPDPAAARDVPVATANELSAAIGAAQAGDVIILAAGSYSLTGASCTADGRADAPIVVRAAVRRTATIELDGLEGFRVSAPHWRFEGLVIRGVCANDSDCEHAFHVTGRADDFVLRDCEVVDFNAQLKVNAENVGGTWETPDRGVVEQCWLHDTHPRDTSNPVTKLNIDTGDDWVVRESFVHDHHKLGGNQVSYGVFLKSGGRRGLVERNLVVCSRDDTTGGVRIGLSFGGGGTAPQFCAPAFDPGVPCAVEHADGIMRNNVIAACSDVGIYLNRAAGSLILYNTLVETAGIDFRFDTTTGEAVGNVLGGVIRSRDGASFTADANREAVTLSEFEAMYREPLAGDLGIAGDVTALVAQGPARADVPDDHCGRARPSGAYTLGALEHSLGDCGAAGGEDAGPPAGDDAGGSTGSDGGSGATDAGGGCGCRVGPERASPGAWILLAAILAIGARVSLRARCGRFPRTGSRRSGTSSRRASPRR